MKLTVDTTAPGVGQIFASAPRTFSGPGQVLAELLEGLTDSIRCALIFHDGDILVPKACEVATKMSIVTMEAATFDANFTAAVGPGLDGTRYNSVLTTGSRTRYDWTVGSGSAVVDLTVSSLSIREFAEKAFSTSQAPGKDNGLMVVDQVTGYVYVLTTGTYTTDWLGSASGITTLATFDAVAADKWE